MQETGATGRQGDRGTWEIGRHGSMGGGESEESGRQRVETGETGCIGR